MSTPVAAGSGALARQYFMAGWYPTGAAVAANAFNPSGHLIKAVLMGESSITALDVSGSVCADDACNMAASTLLWLLKLHV